MNREGIHDFLQELKEETFDRYDIMTVGEASGVSVDQAEMWVGEEQGKFNMIFQFEHLALWNKSVTGGLDVLQLKSALSRWQKVLRVEAGMHYLSRITTNRVQFPLGEMMVSIGRHRPNRWLRCIS